MFSLQILIAERQISMQGKIVKQLSNFYYVECDGIIYECKPRGSFRKQGITPLVGDNVTFTVNDGDHENTLDVILERKNALVRPPLANLDKLFIIASVVDPKLNTLIIDKLIAIAEYKNIEPVVVITKTDLDDGWQEYAAIYRNAGFEVATCDNLTGSGADRIKELMKDSISAFTGNTGVGKSTLLNTLFPELKLQTGETSKKLGRGRHTTRHTELFKTEYGYIADTPGFSSLDIERCEKIMKDDLPYCFREFVPYLENCKFMTNCSHITDKGCAVLQALEDGKIARSRHESYVAMYNEVKDIKEWERR